jgi:hypothetical protein
MLLIVMAASDALTALAPNVMPLPPVRLFVTENALAVPLSVLVKARR